LEGFKNLANCLLKLPHLTTLCLNSTNLTDNGFQVIANSLSQINIKKLYLDDNNIKNGNVLFESLQELNLEYLSLQRIKMDENIEIGNSIKYFLINGCIKYLNLSGNKISDTTSKAIGQGLLKNKSISNLVLVDCSLSNIGANNILSYLKNNVYLYSLDLSNNEKFIGD